jgi:hypothetical protein
VLTAITVSNIVVVISNQWSTIHRMRTKAPLRAGLPLHGLETRKHAHWIQQ